MNKLTTLVRKWFGGNKTSTKPRIFVRDNGSRYIDTDELVQGDPFRETIRALRNLEAKSSTIRLINKDAMYEVVQMNRLSFKLANGGLLQVLYSDVISIEYRPDEDQTYISHYAWLRRDNRGERWIETQRLDMTLDEAQQVLSINFPREMPL